MPNKKANVKNEKQYEALKDKGMSKERAAKIANSPGASSRGGKTSGSSSSRSSSKQGGTTAQKKAAGGKAAGPPLASPDRLSATRIGLTRRQAPAEPGYARAESGPAQARQAPRRVMGERGFEPLKAEPTGLQPVPFGHSGTPPRARAL
jgi:hypothetical protein